MAMQHYPTAQFSQYPISSPFATATAVVASQSAAAAAAAMPIYPLSAQATGISLINLSCT